MDYLEWMGRMVPIISGLCAIAGALGGWIVSARTSRTIIILTTVSEQFLVLSSPMRRWGRMWLVLALACSAFAYMVYASRQWPMI